MNFLYITYQKAQSAIKQVMTAIKADFIAAEKFALPKFTTITYKRMLSLKIYHMNNA